MMLGWLATQVFAQTVPALPETAADLFRPAVGSGPYLVTERAEVRPGAVASVTLGYADELLRIRIDEERSTAVSQVLSAHLAARYGFGPVQIGLEAPVYLSARADDRRTTLGDPALFAKLAAGADGWGIGGLVRLGVPLGGSARSLGYPGPFAEIGAMAELRASRWSVTGNGGLRFVPSQDIGVELNDVAWVKGAAQVEVMPWLSPALEVAAQQPLRDEAEGLGTPVELFAGVLLGCAPTQVQLGVGRGLTGAVGSPRWRGLLALSWTEAGREGGCGNDAD